MSRDRALPILLVLLNLLGASTSYSQGSYIGMGISSGGSGTLNFSGQGIFALPPVAGVFSPIMGARLNAYSARLEYRSIPSSPGLKLEKAAGLEYSYRGYSVNGPLELHSLRVPLTLGLHWGDRKKGWNVVPAFGVYATFPFDQKKGGLPNEIQKVRSLSVGYKMRTDLRWRPIPRFMFLLAYEAYVGVIPVYEKLNYLASGLPGSSTTPQYSLEGYLNISFLYDIASDSE